VVLFTDDFEGGVGQWSGDWGLSSPAEGHSSDNCMNDSPGSNYADYADSPMAMTTAVDLTGAMSGEVSFYAKREIENNWDGCYFEVNAGGGSWTPLATSFTHGSSGQGGQTPSGSPVFEGDNANWVLNTVDLGAYLDESELRFRFRMASDSSINYSGFFVDDFEIMVVRQQTPTPVPGADLLIAGVQAWPNPFNPQTTIKFTNPRSGSVTVGIYDIQGHLVHSLVQGHHLAGQHSAVWNGQINGGGSASSGVYFARMIAGDATATTKLMLVK